MDSQKSQEPKRKPVVFGADFIRPKSVEEGLKFYPIFTEAHLQKNFGFVEDSAISTRVGIMTFPRTGSNALRYTLEKITQINIGDEHQLNSDLPKFLHSRGQVMGSVRNTPIIKGHYPYNPIDRVPDPVSMHRAVILVRDPLPSIISLFTMIMVGDQISKLPMSAFAQHPIYEELLLFYSTRFESFHDFWEKQSIPVLHVRFEDMVSSKSDFLLQLASFIEGENIQGSGSETEKKIKEYVESEGLSSVYRTKESKESKEDVISAHRKEVMVKLVQNCKRSLVKFGYYEKYQKALGLEKETSGFKNWEEIQRENQRTLEDVFKGEARLNQSIFVFPGEEAMKPDPEYAAIRPKIGIVFEELKAQGHIPKV